MKNKLKSIKVELTDSKYMNTLSEYNIKHPGVIGLTISSKLNILSFISDLKNIKYCIL